MRKWDRHKKKYVNVAPGVDPNSFSHTNKKLRTDKGALVDAKPSGKYAEWTRKANKRIGTAGDDEEQLRQQGVLAEPTGVKGLAVMRGRVVGSRMRHRLPDGGQGRAEDGGARVGAPSSLLKKAAKRGGELAPVSQIAKKRAVSEFEKKRLAVKKQHGKAAAKKFVKQAKGGVGGSTSLRQGKNRSTKRGFGAVSMNEFKRGANVRGFSGNKRKR